MHFESGTGCHVETDSLLFVFWPERPIDASPEIHERREPLVQKEVVRTEENEPSLSVVKARRPSV